MNKPNKQKGKKSGKDSRRREKWTAGTLEPCGEPTKDPDSKFRKRRVQSMMTTDTGFKKKKRPRKKRSERNGIVQHRGQRDLDNKRHERQKGGHEHRKRKIKARALKVK